MTRNSGLGGKKHKRMKNEEITQELIFREDGQEYALVTNVLGSGRFHTKSFTDNTIRLSIIRGNMRKRSKHFVRKGDVVLISLRDYQDDKSDIIHLYNEDEVKSLTAYEEISFEDNEDSILFTNENIDEI